MLSKISSLNLVVQSDHARPPPKISPTFGPTPVDLLRARIQAIESELQFDGKAYPDGLIPFPHVLTGRGFFPGGDGLWRDHYRDPVSVPYPYEGIMFVGQDFGSAKKYPPQTKPWESDAVITWRFLNERIERSGIPGPSSFFTNAFLGLRALGSAIGPNPSALNPIYVDVCRDFLAYQIQILNPKLIVIFQSVDEAVYLPLFDELKPSEVCKGVKTAECLGHRRIVLITPHPSSDYGVKGRNLENYRLRCDALAQSWKLASVLNAASLSF